MTLNYADDGDGNVTQMTDSQGDTILYSYDGDSELTTKMHYSTGTIGAARSSAIALMNKSR